MNDFHTDLAIRATVMYALTTTFGFMTLHLDHSLCMRACQLYAYMVHSIVPI